MPHETRPTLSEIQVLGVRVHALDPSRTLQRIGDWIARDQPNYVCVTGVHGIMESQRSPNVRTIHNRAGLVVPDGMPLVWLGRLMGFRDMARVYGPELLLRGCQASLERGWSHYFYGSTPAVLEGLLRELRSRFSGLRIAGWHSPPFRPLTRSEDREVLEKINRSGAQILWVGLGTPKQEQWMAEHAGQLKIPVSIGVGAAFDFISGNKRQAPIWMQRSGLEWLFRLLNEPRRLGPRYLTNNPMFLARLLYGWTAALFLEQREHRKRVVRNP